MGNICCIYVEDPLKENSLVADNKNVNKISVYFGTSFVLQVIDSQIKTGILFN